MPAAAIWLNPLRKTKPFKEGKCLCRLGEFNINEAHQGLRLRRQPFLAFLELLYFSECNLDILLLDKILDGSKGTELSKFCALR